MHTTESSDSPGMNQPSDDARAGAALYGRIILSGYDVVVLGLSSRLLWRCSASEVRALYDACVSDNHLEAGVGTGYFLDHCDFPTAKPRLTLVDLNSHSLAFTARRVRRYAPSVHVADLLS